MDNATLTEKYSQATLNTRDSALTLNIERILTNYLSFNRILNGGKSYVSLFSNKTVDFEDPAEMIKDKFDNCYMKVEGMFHYDEDEKMLVCNGDILRGENFESSVSGQSRLDVYLELDDDEMDAWNNQQDGENLAVTGFINMVETGMESAGFGDLIEIYIVTLKDVEIKRITD